MNLAVITTSQYIGNYLYLDDLYIDQTFLPFFKRNLPSNSSCVKYYTCTNILQLQNTTSVTRFWKVGSGLLLQAFTTRSISYSCKHYSIYQIHETFYTSLGIFTTLSHLLIRPNINNTQNVQRYNLKTIIPRTLSSVNLVKWKLQHTILFSSINDLRKYFISFTLY